MARRHTEQNTEPLLISGCDEVHTPDHPYCDHLGCWCHTDVTYHASVTGPLLSHTDDEIEAAYSFLELSWS